MAHVKEIYNNIISIKNTQKITKAMEVVAASKILKAQELMKSSLPYSRMILKLINHITLGNLEYKHPYLNKRNVKHVCYFIISTDRGLAGSLNINLFKSVLVHMNKWIKKNIDIQLILIGSKAVSFFSSMKFKILTKLINLGNNPLLSEILKPIEIIIKFYEKGYLDNIYIANNKFINNLIQKPTITKILPILKKKESNLNFNKWDYLYEPDSKILLDTIFRRYIESQIYQKIVENLVSEQVARMISMKSATENGKNLIKELQILYNKERQTSITQEIIEIISGASAI